VNLGSLDLETSALAIPVFLCDPVAISILKILILFYLSVFYAGASPSAKVTFALDNDSSETNRRVLTSRDTFNLNSYNTDKLSKSPKKKMPVSTYRFVPLFSSISYLFFYCSIQALDHSI